jgi:methionyl-tRNA formyltransferase
LSIAVLARTRWGLDAARQLAQAGRTINVVATSAAEEFYRCGANEYQIFAQQTDANFIDASKLSPEELATALLGSGADVAISVNWPHLLNQEIISAFPLGIINAHAGDLPRYRGNACPNWAILNGEAHIGLCAHLMQADSLDSGPVMVREYFPLTDDTYIGDVYAWLDQRVPAVLAIAAEQLLQGARATPQPLDPKLALRCYPRRPQDGRIDWRAPADTVHRLIRASSRPFSGAYAFLEDGRRVTVWSAAIYAHWEPFCAVPGHIMLRADSGVVVACGEGCLLLREVEVEGLSKQESQTTLRRSLRARLS